MQTAAATWNAWFDGGSRQFVQPSRLEGEKFKLLGTPWHRGAQPSSGKED